MENILIIRISRTEEEIRDHVPPYVVIAGEYCNRLFYSNHIAATMEGNIKVECIGELYQHIKTIRDINRHMEQEQRERKKFIIRL